MCGMQANVRRVNIAGRSVTYTLKMSNRARYARLEIDHVSGLMVILPQGCPDNRAVNLILEKKHWILKKLSEYNKAKLQRGLNEEKGVLTYLGRELKITLKQTSGSVEKAVLEDSRLALYLNAEISQNAAVEQWLRSMAEEVIAAKAQKLGAFLGIRYCKLTIISARKRWGSCSSKGNLSFNWKLIMAPEEVIDYVVAHEVCHLVELNHSKRFWHLVEQCCPEWRLQRKWLRKHQMEIMAAV